MYAMILPGYIQFALDTINSNGFEAYTVGGCVRDNLYGRPPRDYDITTNAIPKEIINCFPNNKLILTGIKHGTVTIVIEGEKVDITTYRVDGTYNDHRHPDAVEFSSNLKDDLYRRDFTFNAIAYSHKTCEIDYFGGLDDLHNGIVRCVGNPNERFDEDALRIMRALRFAASFQFKLHEDTKKAVFAQKENLLNIPIERITSEFRKIISYEGGYDVLVEYAKVFMVFIPEIHLSTEFTLRNYVPSSTIWIHMAKCCSLARNYDEVVRLALLFHDIEKPVSAFLDENAQLMFEPWYDYTAKTVKSILIRMKFPKKVYDVVPILIKNIPYNGEWDKPYVQGLMATYGFKIYFQILAVRKLNELGKDMPNRYFLSSLDKARELGRRILENGDPINIFDLEITGGELCDIGFKGPEVGILLRDILWMCIRGEIRNSRLILLEHARMLYEEKTNPDMYYSISTLQ